MFGEDNSRRPGGYTVHKEFPRVLIEDANEKRCDSWQRGEVYPAARPDVGAGVGGELLAPLAVVEVRARPLGIVAGLMDAVVSSDDLSTERMEGEEGQE